MQDTNNLKRKVNVTYPKLVRECELKGDQKGADYWRSQIKWTEERIATRDRNRKKNRKKK